jgi:hypothetical protein
MRAQLVASRLLARPAALLLLSGLASGPAWAAGVVTFNQMIVERCPEKSCEWQLSCGVGGPQETQLFTGKEARTKYKINIGRGLNAPQFPASIHCTAWEDDGWFGESWEKVGSNSVEVASGGDYRLDIASGEQGAVRVLLSVDSLDIAIPAPAAAKPAPARRGAAPKPAPVWRFAAAFTPQPGGRAVVVGMEQKPFKDLVARLSAEGLQIDDVETLEQGGKRLWSGIFRNSPEEVLLLTDQDWEKFSSNWKKLTGVGSKRRLVDLEIYPQGGQNTFAGIYRDIGENHAFWVGQKRDEFEEKVKELSENKGQKLLDVEIYRPSAGGGTLLYAGPFRQSNLETTLWAGLTQAELDQKLQGLRGKDLQVVDLETYRDGKERNFDVLVRSGPTGEVVTGLDTAAFTAKWRDMASKGQRLVSLEAYQE